MALACRQIELGRSSSIPEVMVKWEGSPVPTPRTYFRTSSMVAYAEVCGPEDALAQCWNDIVQCALVGSGVATLTAILAGPAAALPVFKASFTSCLAEKLKERAGEIQVALSTQQKPNEDWHQ